jgi:outer membrane protein insertion porin family
MSVFSAIRLSIVVCMYGVVTAGAQNPPSNPPAGRSQGSRLAADVIERIEIRGARRIPADILRTILLSKVGELFDEATLRRDFTTLWNTGRFDDIQIGKETGERGGVIVRFVVTERALR